MSLILHDKTATIAGLINNFGCLELVFQLHNSAVPIILSKKGAVNQKWLKNTDLRPLVELCKKRLGRALFIRS